MSLLVHLLKIETDLKAARLHFHLQIRICVLYRFFSTDAGTSARHQQRLQEIN